MTKKKPEKPKPDRDELKTEEQYRREADEYLDRMFRARFGRKPYEKPKPEWQRHLDRLLPSDEPDGT